MTLQRVHAWRAGENVPKVFEHLGFVVLALRWYAEKAGADVEHCRELTDLGDWKKRWKAALQWRPPVDNQNCPYPGLAAYERSDSGRFFGRDEVCAELCALVGSVSTDDGEAGMVILVGESGAGKSSLLRAGVVPRLLAREGLFGPETVVAVVSPGADPESSLDVGVGTADSQWAAAGRGLVVVDQLEELFTVCENDAARVRFLERLAALAAPARGRRVAVVAALRADFFSRCLAYPILEQALKKRSYVLGSMSVAELRSAVTGPARSAGLQLEAGLAEVAVTELCSLRAPAHRLSYDAGALPLLSHVMAATWQRRDVRKRLLTTDGYREAGGVAGSIETTAEQAWNGLEVEQQGEARSLLLDLVYLAPDGHSSRRRVSRRQLLARAGDPVAAQAVLEQLTDARLLSADRDAVFLTHEIVLVAWTRLREWVEQDRAGQLMRQQIEADAAEWDRAARDPDLLYRRRRLAGADTATRRRLSATAEQFIGAARRARVRSRRLTSAAAAGVAAVTVVTLVLAVTAYANHRESLVREQNEQLASILAVSEVARSTDPTLSALLDVAAHELAPADENVRTRLLATQNLPLATAAAIHSGRVTDLHYLPARDLLISGGDKTVKLWDAATFDRPRELATIARTASVISVAVDRDGTRMAVAAGDRLEIWDIADAAAPRSVGAVTAPGQLAHLALDPDGHVLAATVADGKTVGLWHLDDDGAPTAIGPEIHYTEAVTAIRFHPTAGWLAVAAADTVHTYVPAVTPDQTYAPGPTLTVPVGPGRAIAFSPDGTSLAVGSSLDVELADAATDAWVTLWTVTDLARPRQVGPAFRVATRTTVEDLAFGPDNTTLAVADRGQVTVWNTAMRERPLQLGEPLRAASTACVESGWLGAVCDNVPTALAFGPDQDALAVGSAQGLLRRWSLPPAVIAGPHQWNLMPGLSDNRRMVLTGVRGSVRVWDIANPSTARQLFDLGPGSAPPYTLGASISRDGRRVAKPAEDPRRVQIIDLSDPNQPVTVADIAGASTAAFLGEDRLIVWTMTGPRISFRIFDITDVGRPVPLSEPVVVAEPESPQITDFTAGLAGASIDAAARTMVVLAPQRVGKDPNIPYVLRLFDLSDPRHPRELDHQLSDPARPFRGAVLTTDGKTLVTLAADTLQVWDPTHEELRPLSTPISTNGLNLVSAETSADGRWLATAGADSTVQLWDLRDRAQPRRYGQPISLPDSTAYNLAFAPTGTDLVAAGNGALRIWSLDVEAAVTRICSAARTSLTQQIWQVHLPDVPYRRPCD